MWVNATDMIICVMKPTTAGTHSSPPFQPTIYSAGIECHNIKAVKGQHTPTHTHMDVIHLFAGDDDGDDDDGDVGCMLCSHRCSRSLTCAHFSGIMNASSFDGRRRRRRQTNH